MHFANRYIITYQEAYSRHVTRFLFSQSQGIEGEKKIQFKNVLQNSYLDAHKTAPSMHITLAMSLSQSTRGDECKKSLDSQLAKN